MRLKRLVLIVVGIVSLAGLSLGSIYYGTILSNRLAPEYTKPAKMVEKWDGPSSAPLETEK
jgi:hypothetical protein